MSFKCAWSFRLCTDREVAAEALADDGRVPSRAREDAARVSAEGRARSLRDSRAREQRTMQARGGLALPFAKSIHC